MSTTQYHCLLLNHIIFLIVYWLNPFFLLLKNCQKWTCPVLQRLLQIVYNIIGTRPTYTYNKVTSFQTSILPSKCHLCSCAVTYNNIIVYPLHQHDGWQVTPMFIYILLQLLQYIDWRLYYSRQNTSTAIEQKNNYTK